MFIFCSVCLSLLTALEVFFLPRNEGFWEMEGHTMPSRVDPGSGERGPVPGASH
jgi:hypothetical protein